MNRSSIVFTVTSYSIFKNRRFLVEVSNTYCIRHHLLSNDFWFEKARTAIQLNKNACFASNLVCKTWYTYDIYFLFLSIYKMPFIIFMMPWNLYNYFKLFSWIQLWLYSTYTLIRLNHTLWPYYLKLYMHIVSWDWMTYFHDIKIVII